MARPNENITIKDINGDDRTISEYDVSAVTISRLKELSGLIKKQINLLTKKEISDKNVTLLRVFYWWSF